MPHSLEEQLLLPLKQLFLLEQNGVHITTLLNILIATVLIQWTFTLDPEDPWAPLDPLDPKDPEDPKDAMAPGASRDHKEFKV